MQFGELLIERGLVRPDDITAALLKQKEMRARGINERLGVLLVLSGKISAEVLADIVVELSRQPLLQPANT